MSEAGFQPINPLGQMRFDLLVHGEKSRKFSDDGIIGRGRKRVNEGGPLSLKNRALLVCRKPRLRLAAELVPSSDNRCDISCLSLLQEREVGCLSQPFVGRDRFFYDDTCFSAW